MMATILGMLIGFTLKYGFYESWYQKIVKFNSNNYFLFMLPPIMFQVGFSMNLTTFLRNIHIINAFAIVSTIVCSLLFGAIMYFALKMTSIRYGFIESWQLG